MKNKNILIVGGAGFIGSHVNKMLDVAGYNTIVLDNLSLGNKKSVTRGVFIPGNMEDSKLLDTIFTNYDISAVMHFAAFIDVGESTLNPLKYYQNNVANTLSLLTAMQKHGIKICIFSSTAAIFGMPETRLISEEHPKNPINPYGHSKLMIEKILSDFDKAYGMKFCSLRYFNAAGGDPDGEIRNFKEKETNLIPIVLKILTKQKGAITIYGADYPTPDGTCIRDYVHVCDLASAHIAAMEKLFQGSPSVSYNLGNGKGFSVKEVIHMTERVTGIQASVIEREKRAGDPPILLADSKLACKELNWKPKYTELKTMIEHALKIL